MLTRYLQQTKALPPQKNAQQTKALPPQKNAQQTNGVQKTIWSINVRILRLTQELRQSHVSRFMQFL
ncbi:hypothetical protein HYN46_12740 [Aquirhabdus parva]|uniref:Uncharacterized protein n=1 Tax=Aquirhabdus parva TaxID=2283318 RepID=A0A345P8L2_9GAMM|nr:hypothetical protein HYN46_12740 [Aquirhabdus parva]